MSTCHLDFYRHTRSKKLIIDNDTKNIENLVRSIKRGLKLSARGYKMSTDSLYNILVKITDPLKVGSENDLRSMLGHYGVDNESSVDEY